MSRLRRVADPRERIVGIERLCQHSVDAIYPLACPFHAEQTGSARSVDATPVVVRRLIADHVAALRR